jgi:hypothetical protein
VDTESAEQALAKVKQKIDTLLRPV